jgi:hypothetical protein
MRKCWIGCLLLRRTSTSSAQQHRCVGPTRAARAMQQEHGQASYWSLDVMQCCGLVLEAW